MTLGRAQRVLRCLAVGAWLYGALAVAAAQPSAEEIAAAKRAFVDKMVREHRFDRDELAPLIESAEINQTILDTMARPAERVVPWFEYRNIFLTEERIAAGARFWAEHAETLDAISKRYGVAPEMILAIVGVETYFGTRMGRYRVIDALATLAFAYPPRAQFFASELEAFLLLAREEQVDVQSALGSYAGAMGAGQFIPSSYRAYAVDGDDDGKRDLWTNWGDVFGSVANYFAKHGWKADEPVVDVATRPSAWEGPEPTNRLELNATVGALAEQGYVFTTQQASDAPAAAFSFEAAGGGFEYWVGYHNFRVVTRYNRSTKYALAAYQLGQAIRERYHATLATETRSAG